MVLGNKEAPEGQQSFNVYSPTVAENLPQHLLQNRLKLDTPPTLTLSERPFT